MRWIASGLRASDRPGAALTEALLMTGPNAAMSCFSTADKTQEREGPRDGPKIRPN
jgi:hypothetical protein